MQNLYSMKENQENIQMNEKQQSLEQSVTKTKLKYTKQRNLTQLQ